jgi:hypothetical protein
MHNDGRGLSHAHGQPFQQLLGLTRELVVRTVQRAPAGEALALVRFNTLTIEATVRRA